MFPSLSTGSDDGNSNVWVFSINVRCEGFGAGAGFEGGVGIAAVG